VAPDISLHYWSIIFGSGIRHTILRDSARTIKKVGAGRTIENIPL